MSHKPHDARNYLAELLPLAKAEAPKIKQAERRSALGKAQGQFLREANLDGLYIFSPPLGGWIADIYFKNIPVGYSNVIGTPVGQPHKSFEEARTAAITMLALVLHMEEQDRKNPPEKLPPVFLLHDIEITLPKDLHELALIQERVVGQSGYGGADNAIKRLEEVLAKYFPETKCNYESFTALSRDDQIAIMAVLAMCTMDGILRYPPREPAVMP